MTTTARPIVTALDIPNIDRLFENSPGYVMDFTDKTFGEFFIEHLGIDINEKQFHAGGSSKGKRLRYFLRNAEPRTAALALRKLIDYRADWILRFHSDEPVPRTLEKVNQLIARLEQGQTTTEGIDRFTADETLDELVASIERDIKADKPQVALDRLHTYCMKKFAHLLKAHGSEPADGETLNARAGRYFNPLRQSGRVRPISTKIMKTTVEVFELFNGIRNNESLAHDNVLVAQNEARYIFEAVQNLLRFVKSIEGATFERWQPPTKA